MRTFVDGGDVHGWLMLRPPSWRWRRSGTWSRWPNVVKMTMSVIVGFVVCWLPLSSDRQHLSYDVCLEVRGESVRTVLFCIVYW